MGYSSHIALRSAHDESTIVMHRDEVRYVRDPNDEKVAAAGALVFVECNGTDEAGILVRETPEKIAELLSAKDAR